MCVCVCAAHVCVFVCACVFYVFVCVYVCLRLPLVKI